MTELAPAPPPAAVGLGALIRPTILVTLLAIGTHATNFFIQMLMARFFGAGPELDAYFAAATLPQYAVTVILGTLPVIFIPVVAGYLSTGSDAEAARVIRTVTTLLFWLMSFATVAALLFASPLLRVMTPGLAPETHTLAVQLAWILWPGIIAAAIVTLCTGVHHAYGRFAWAALVPLLAGIVNVAALAMFGARYGVIVVAVAATATLLLQMIALAPVFRHVASAPLSFSHPAVRDVLVRIVPLLVAGLFIRANVVAERFLASGLEAGSISHVAYASRALAFLTMLLSGGIATVMFPRMARSVAAADWRAVDHDLTMTLRMMFVLIAPAVAIGTVLARPGVATLFERGRFTPADTLAVSSLLEIFLLSLPGATIGMLAGRVLYALRASNLLAVGGAIEGALYACYTVLLVRSIGVTGIAWGLVIYTTGSTAWLLVAVGRRIAWSGMAETAGAAIRTTLAAIIAAVAAATAMRVSPLPMPQLLLGGLAGVITYTATLTLVNARDARLLARALAMLRR